MWGEALKKYKQFCYDNFGNYYYIDQIVRSRCDLPIFNAGEIMQIAFCDDEKVYLDLLVGYAKKYLSSCEKDISQVVIDRYSSGEELLEAYRQGKFYDLVYLDIRMDKINGFETAKEIRVFDDKAMIIFITSLGDYILNCFEYRPFWFIIKPVSEEKFRYVFNRALMEISNTRTRKYSFFTKEYGNLCLDIDKIIYLESVLRKINIHAAMEQYTYYANMAEEEEKLKKYDFVRIHKGYLVNMAYIQRINKSNVVLKNSMVLPLSERRYKYVFDNFTSYLARCSI
jgi:DNA-binding LytR/AlgR family response regulator